MSPAEEDEITAIMERSAASTCRCAKDVPTLVTMVRARDHVVATLLELLNVHGFHRGQCEECLQVDGAHTPECRLGAALKPS